MMRTIAMAAALVASGTGAHAQTQKAAQPVSPFILCDGQTGHVGAGETFLRLLAITATAGLSEGATTKGDVSLRAKGLAGVQACNTALASEQNEIRRVQLGLSRTIHYLEADQPDQAIVSAQEVMKLAGARKVEWGLSHTAGASARHLEAVALAKLGRSAEAEDAAVDAGLMAGQEIFAIRRAMPFMTLTPRMTDKKRAFLDLAGRTMPETLLSTAAVAHSWAGEHVRAAQLVHAYRDAAITFLPEVKLYYVISYEATFLAVAGKIDEAQALAKMAREELKADIEAGARTSRAGAVAMTEEHLAFVDLVAQSHGAKAGDAYNAFASRGSWSHTPPPLVSAFAERARPHVKVTPATDSPLTSVPHAYRDDRMKSSLLAVSQEDRIEKLYSQVAFVVGNGSYSSSAGAVWKVGAKPRFLSRVKSKEERTFEIVDATSRVFDQTSAEVILFHSALIARSRGQNGFVILPHRSHAQIMGVRFGNIGTPGFPVEATNRTDEIIANLAPYFPKPGAR